MPETGRIIDPSAVLAEFKARNEWRIEYHAYTPWTVEHDVPEGDVRRLLAALDSVLTLTSDWEHNWASGEAPHELAIELRTAITRELTGNLEPKPLKRPEGCICTMFRDTGGFRIADLACPVHGVAGTDPGDGNWEKTGKGNDDA